MIGEPLLIGHPGRAASDDAKVLVAKPHDREVGLEAAVVAENRGVDVAAGGHVHLPQGDLLHRPQGAWALDVEDGEGGEVEDARPLAHGEVLGVDDGRPPARLPLSRAPGDAIAELIEQRPVGLVPHRPLPAGRLEERRSQLPLPIVEWSQAHVAVGSPLLGGVDDPVCLVETLGGPRAHMRARPLMFVEAGDVRRVQVDLGLAVHHPFGKRLPGAGAFLDPDGCRRPEASHVRRLPEDWHPVGREREDAVDGVLHAHFLIAHDLGHQLEGVLHLELEVGLRERKLGRRQRGPFDGRDVFRVVQDRPVRVGADLEVASGLALVHVGVHVADDRHLDVAFGAGEARHRADVDHLMHGRGERDAGAGHARDARAPDSAGDHDRVGLDLAGGRAHAANAAALDVDRHHLRLRHHLQGARGLGAFPHDRARAQPGV